MAFQTIGAENKHDIFYRYKMPSLITKIEGRGNGIKTNVVNMVDIAKALGRPASYTTKYFGCELGAQSKFDEKTGTAFVNGSHETSKLADLLEKFIKKFVQCYKEEGKGDKGKGEKGKGDKGKGDKIEGGCGNPETEIIITKSQMIKLKCAACGYLSKVDMRDKLTTFIIKNPPESKKGLKDKKSMRRAEKERLKEGEAADEDLKKLKKEAVKKLGSSKEKATSKNQSPTHSQADKHEKVPAGAEDSDDDVEWQTDTSSVAAQQTIQQQLNAVTANMVMLSADEEEKPKPVKPKTNGVSESEQLVAAIKEFIKKGSPASQLKPFLESLTGPRQEKVDVLFEALFEGVGKGFSKEAVKKKKYIAAVVEEDGSQPLLLHAIEVFCGKVSPEAAKEVALVLKALYDDDVLEEEFIVEWYEKGFCGSNKSLPIWKNVKPFVEWLQSAESESEEE